ncbi:MAG: hypothetical protein ACI8XU_001694 [Kiritimatiellia bacterium]|jgi:hypothetical protein
MLECGESRTVQRDFNGNIRDQYTNTLSPCKIKALLPIDARWQWLSEAFILGLLPYLRDSASS